MGSRCADYVELTTGFGRESELIGVVSLPATTTPRGCAAILLSSGLVHHVGPNRLWVRLARRLAGLGIPALRFDLSAIGDSLPSTDPTPPPARWVAESRLAMDLMAKDHSVDRFVLIGNCMGSSVGALAALQDDRVTGLVSINPQVRGGPRYRTRLLLRHPASWRRLLHGRGKLRLGAGSTLAVGVKPAVSSAVQAVAAVRALASRGVSTLIVACEWDPSFDFLRTHWPALTAHGEASAQVQAATIAGSNHDFTLLAAQDRLLQIVPHWVAALAPEAAG